MYRYNVGRKVNLYFLYFFNDGKHIYKLCPFSFNKSDSLYNLNYIDKHSYCCKFVPSIFSKYK